MFLVQNVHCGNLCTYQNLAVGVLVHTLSHFKSSVFFSYYLVQGFALVREIIALIENGRAFVCCSQAARSTLFFLLFNRACTMYESENRVYMCAITHPMSPSSYSVNIHQPKSNYWEFVSKWACLYCFLSKAFSFFPRFSRAPSLANLLISRGQSTKHAKTNEKKSEP